MYSLFFLYKDFAFTVLSHGSGKVLPYPNSYNSGLDFTGLLVV